MRTITLAAAALLCSASALAQTTGSTTPDPTTNPEASAPPDMGASGTTAQPSTGETMSSQTSSSGGVDLAAHDADKDGALSPLEFGQQVAAMNADSSLSAEASRERFSRASGNAAIKLLNQSAPDFSKADTNMDKRVDSTELAQWQSGGTSASASTTTSTPMTSGAGTVSPAPAPDTSPTTGSSAPNTSGAGTTDAVPDTGATMSPSTTTEPSSDEASPETKDDMQNSTDPNESTTTPPPSL
jgi:hypothetical protein